MTTSPSRLQRSSPSAAADVDAELARLATFNVEELRAFWRDRMERRAPEALSKDLLGSHPRPKRGGLRSSDSFDALPL